MTHIIAKEDMPDFEEKLIKAGWRKQIPTQGRIAKFMKNDWKCKNFVFVEPHSDTHYKVSALNNRFVDQYFAEKESSCQKSN